MIRPIRRSAQTLCLLQALLEDGQEWRYGYDLSKATGLKSGTLYPILIRMHGAGWLEAQWGKPEAPGRPPRHLYRLSVDAVPMARRLLAEAAPTTDGTRRTALGEA